MKYSRQLIPFILLIALISIDKSLAFDSGVSEKAHAVMQEFHKNSNSPGLAVSVGHKGVIAWSAGFGFADLEQSVAVDPAATRFRIGSVIKSMTAYAISQLVAEGKLDLDLPVQTYVPGFPEKRWPVSTRQLLAHLSGIRHYQGSEFFSRDHYASVNDGLVIFQDDPLVHEPGSAFLYSSYAYNLLGAVIEGASGQPYLDFMASRVFTPMKMDKTVPDYLSEIIPGRGRYYYERDGQVINAPEADNSYKWPSGGVIGTSDDLVRFGLAILRNEFFDDALREAFWTMQHTDSGEETGYGLGFRVTTDENGTLWIGHGGGSIGGTTQFWISPEDDLVISMISNLSSFNFETVLVSLAEVFTGQPSPE